MTDFLTYLMEHCYEFFGVTFSIIYVILSIRQNVLCWPALIIASILNGYAFLIIGLPLQSIMQLFFIGVGISGWHNWSNKRSTELIVKSWGIKKHFFWVLLGSVCTLVLFRILKNDILLNTIFESNNPFFDSLMFVFNIIPMYMTTKKILESWIYFIWIDIISGSFYFFTGGYFYCFLFFFYIPFATYGFLTWKKDLLYHAD